jgi:hypothetical protein
MRKQIKRLTAGNTFGVLAAPTEMAPIDLPREGLITEVRLKFAATQTMTATGVDDCYRRSVFNSLKIEGDSGRAFLGLNGIQTSTLFSLWQEFLGGSPQVHSNGAGIALAVPDVGSAAFIEVMRFHPGSNPRDPFDMTAVIPARALAQLQLKLTTAASDSPDANGLITAGTYRYEVCQVLDQPVHPGMMSPVGSTLTLVHTADYSDYSYKIDVPAGAFLRGIIIMTRDDTGEPAKRRKSDELTAVRLETPKNGTYVFESLMPQLVHNMAGRFGFAGLSQETGPAGVIANLSPRPNETCSILPAGFVYIDLRAFANPLYGLDLRGYQTGDFKLACTIANFAATDVTTIYWDQLLPVEQSMVGK